MSPEIDKLGEFVKKNRKDVIIARLEGDSNSEIADEFGIQSFPKVALFYPTSTQVDSYFKGERTLEGFKAWLNTKAPVLTKYMKDDESLSLKMIGEDLKNEKTAESENSFLDFGSNKKTGIEKNDLVAKEKKSIENNKITYLTQNIKESDPEETEILNTMDTVKNELKFLHEKFEITLKNLEELKHIVGSQSKTAEEIKMDLINEYNLTPGKEVEEEIIEKEEEAKPIKTGSNKLLSRVSAFDVIVVFLVIFILIAGFMTFHKIYNKL